MYNFEKIYITDTVLFDRKDLSNKFYIVSVGKMLDNFLEQDFD